MTMAVWKTPTGVIVFNPNTDNSLLMRGDPEAANAIWLLNWRKALDRAKKTGGRCVQIIVQGGLLRNAGGGGEHGGG